MDLQERNFKFIVLTKTLQKILAKNIGITQNDLLSSRKMHSNEPSPHLYAPEVAHKEENEHIRLHERIGRQT